jgi:hypothetical protein
MKPSRAKAHFETARICEVHTAVPRAAPAALLPHVQHTSSAVRTCSSGATDTTASTVGVKHTCQQWQWR